MKTCSCDGRITSNIPVTQGKGEKVLPDDGLRSVDEELLWQGRTPPDNRLLYLILRPRDGLLVGCEDLIAAGEQLDAIAIILSKNMASLAGITNVEFVQSDLLSPEFTEVGMFDTVTAIHLLEHFLENQLPQTLGNLLKVTRQRLLIAVPHKQQAEVAYGHKQVFSREKLEQWGKWCVDQLG